MAGDATRAGDRKCSTEGGCGAHGSRSGRRGMLPSKTQLFGMRLELSPKPGATMGPIERGAVAVAMQLSAMQSIGRQRRPQYRSIDRGRGRAKGQVGGLRNVERWRMTRNGQAGCGGGGTSPASYSATDAGVQDSILELEQLNHQRCPLPEFKPGGANKKTQPTLGRTQWALVRLVN